MVQLPAIVQKAMNLNAFPSTGIEDVNSSQFSRSFYKGLCESLVSALTARNSPTLLNHAWPLIKHAMNAAMNIPLVLSALDQHAGLEFVTLLAWNAQGWEHLRDKVKEIIQGEATQMGKLERLYLE